MSNIACKIYKEQLEMLLSLPNQEEAKNILYQALINSYNHFENQFDNQNENQNENAYISISISILSINILNLLSKNIVWREFSNNYGGKREKAGRPKSEENQEDNSNQNIQKNQKNQKNQNAQTETESKRESKEKVSGSDNTISKDTSLVPASASNQEDLFETDCSTYAGKNINQQRCLSTSSADDDTFPNYLHNKYKWEGSVIKLVKKDFVAWQSLYPNIDLRRELENRDDWLSKQPENIQKSWFLSTKKYLEKLNKEAA